MKQDIYTLPAKICVVECSEEGLDKGIEEIYSQDYKNYQSYNYNSQHDRDNDECYKPSIHDIARKDRWTAKKARDGGRENPISSASKFSFIQDCHTAVRRLSSMDDSSSSHISFKISSPVRFHLRSFQFPV